MSYSDYILERIASLRQHTRSGVKAPNKPVTLLWALERIARELPRLTPFATAEPELKTLLNACGTPGSPPSYAFWRLQSDGLWEVAAAGPMPARSGDKEPRVTALRAHASGGFTPKVHVRLRQSHVLRNEARALLEAQLADSGREWQAHSRPTWEGVRRRIREAAFREAVLSAYESACAVCGWRLKVRGEAVAVDAAHVRPLSADGRDAPDNGLALCSLHHRLFDVGLFTWDGNRRLAVSRLWEERLRGNMISLANFSGQLLPHPKPTAMPLSEHNLTWHRHHVFLV